MSDTDSPIRQEAGYLELRRHELRKSRVMMVDGHLTTHSHTSEGGVSARAYRDGYWGFAAESGAGDAAAAVRVRAQADRLARAMARFGPRRQFDLPGGSHRGEHQFRGRAPWSASEAVDCLGGLYTLCRQRYPDLKSIRLLLGDEHHRKWLSTSRGGESLASIQRAMLYVVFSVDDAGQRPVELTEVFSCKGSLADLQIAPEQIVPTLDQLHRHLLAKREAVPARGGQCTVVLGPELAGILAHEAMGHPCEADLVLGGAVTGHLLGRPVASERVTMVDFAHSVDGAEAMCPVYVDDEGTPARDVVLIERGVLRALMHSRETAARLGGAPTGSARAYGPADEPLIRMRNTAILPGTDKLDDMIAGVDDGYLLLKTGNGQADSTTEFMFGISLGYEIRGGRIGRALRDTTVSGSAIKVLQSVDAVSDDMQWNCSGYCGKKQLMVVSMGGPALRARAHLGGE
jgi:TldD protein